MADSILAALRDRVRLGALVFWCGFFGFLFWVLHEPIVQLGITLATGVVLGLSGVLIEVYDLRSAVRSLSNGLVALVSASVLFVFSDGAGVSIVLLVAAVWMILNAGQVLRHEGLRSEERPNSYHGHDDRDGHEVYHEYVVQQVHETLRERPMTRLELLDALDFERQLLDRALDTLDHRDCLAREGSELRVASSESGTPTRFRDELGGVLARLARPATIEFGNHGTADSNLDPSRPESAITRERP